MYREEAEALRSSRRISDHGQGTTAWRAFLPDQYRVKGLIVTCIGWYWLIMGSKLKEKSGRWTTAKDAPQPKGLTLIPENTEGENKFFFVIL
jgi:hypothetical protein